MNGGHIMNNNSEWMVVNEYMYTLNVTGKCMVGVQ
jgi:hypothetical protein